MEHFLNMCKKECEKKPRNRVDHRQQRFLHRLHSQRQVCPLRRLAGGIVEFGFASFWYRHQFHPTRTTRRMTN